LGRTWFILTQHCSGLTTVLSSVVVVVVVSIAAVVVVVVVSIAAVVVVVKGSPGRREGRPLRQNLSGPLAEFFYTGLTYRLQRKN